MICFAADRFLVASAATGQLEERPSPGPYRVVSPDGQRLLTLSNQTPTVSALDGSNARVLANFQMWSSGTRWSPSGRHVAVLESAPQCAPIHLLAADGSTRYRIPDDSGCPAVLSWSPSGAWIATTLRNSTTPVLRLYKADGSEMREVPLRLPFGHYPLTAAWITE